MKRPLIYSAILHLTVLFLILVGFYNPFQRTQRTETPIMMEFVHVAEQSAAPVLAPETIQDIDQPLPPQPTPTPTPSQPEPPKPEPEPQPQPEPEPEKPEPPKPEEPKPDPKPVEAEPIPDKKAKEKPKEKKKEEPKPKKKQKAEITLDKKKKPTSKTEDKKTDKKKKSTSKSDDKKKDKKKKDSKSFEDLLKDIEKEDNGAPSSGRGAPASTVGSVLTASEKDALSRHMSRCWLIPAGLRDAKNIRVPIKIQVARDGTVKNAEIKDKARMKSDPAYRTAAESARRAVLDPNCSPLPIPKDKYDMFKEFTFNFDPKEMF